MNQFKSLIFLLLLLFVASCSERHAVEYVPFKKAATDRWGFIAADGTIKMEGRYDLLPSAVVNDRYNVQNADGDWMLYSFSAGKPVCNRTFRMIGYFWEDATMAVEGDRLEIINKSGKVISVLSPAVIEAHNFSEKLALVRFRDGSYGYVDPKGHFTSYRFDYASDFSDGVAVAANYDVRGFLKYTAIDKSGKIVAILRVKENRILEHYHDGLLLYKDASSNQYTALDKKGNFVKLTDVQLENIRDHSSRPFLIATVGNRFAAFIYDDYMNETLVQKFIVSEDMKAQSSPIPTGLSSVGNVAFASFNVAGQDGNSALLKLKIRSGNGNWIRVGIRYKSGYDTDFTIRDLAADDKGYYQVNLKGLHPDATYQVRAFAISEKNLSESELAFRTDSKVILEQPGTLPDVISSRQKFSIAELKIVGPINGTDVGLIHEMAGFANYGSTLLYTSGILAKLDLSEADIKAGGKGVNHENHYWYTEDNTVSRIFGDYSKALRKIILPASMTKCVGGAFCDTNVDSIGVPSSNPYYTSVDGVLFNKNKTKLVAFPPRKAFDTYTIPNTVKELDDFSFACVNRVKNLIIPNSVTTLRDEAFCNFQKEGTFSGELTLPASITHIQIQPFYGSWLKKIKVSASVPFLIYGFFQHCRNLESVTLGPSIKEIGEKAFLNCISLKEVHCLSPVPPKVSDSEIYPVFQDVDRSKCVIYVPKGSLRAYKSAAVWSTFAHIEED